jgi:dipeptidyl aminopeptidase/acylaminoacyl peptidase
MSRYIAIVSTAGFLFLSSLPLLAEPPTAGKHLKVDQYLDYETVSDPQISPDGASIVYTRRWVDKLQDRFETALWIVGSDGSRNRFLAKGSSAVWSPDGARIAYVAEGEPKGPQIFVHFMDAESATSQVTRVDQAPADVRWSPDGKQIGFSMFVPHPSDWKIDMPQPPEGASWTKAPMVVDRLHYRQDRVGYTEPGSVHLFVIPADGGTPRALTSGDWSVGARFDGLKGEVGWDWTPDGKTIVVDGLDAPDADLRYRDSDLYVIDVATGTKRKLTSEPGTWTSPVVSPDGRRVAFTGFSHSRASYHASELYVIGLDGTGQKKLSGDLDRDTESLHWASDGSGVFFTADDAGTSNLRYAALSGGMREVTRGAHMLSLSSVARTGVGAGVQTSVHAPPDVVRVETASGGITQLTHVNDDLLARLELAEVEPLEYTSKDGARVSGWLVEPPGFDAARRYPLILEIHGGPHGMYDVGFNFMFQSFAADGFVVLYTNPRGSTGYGSPFGNAIERAYPSVDYDDLMAGVDAAIARGSVDARNLFVGGCSGGGVLSSWVIGHTTRFAAAAVRCPVIDWISFSGHTDIPLFTHNFFDAPFWEKPEAWLKQSSLMYVGNVTTPTLLMTGVLDMRTPMAQTEEYYAALKMRGVPTKLLRFEGEYHGTSSKPSNFLRTVLYMESWYRQYGHWDELEPTQASR